jgi:F0F1-type ATP synthase membrane subunit c/vacuolar-type H+-ATPase subunit K
MENQTTIKQEYRTLALIWFVLLFSQAMFLIVIFTSKPEVFNFDFSAPVSAGGNTPLIIALAVLALVNLSLSFVIRKVSVAQAIARQDPQYVRLGLIIGCAFCESVSVMGMIVAFAFSYQYFFLWFALGIAGIILHFPRRKHLLAASGKTENAKS